VHKLSDPLRNHHPVTLTKSYLISHCRHLLNPKYLIFLQLEKKGNSNTANCWSYHQRSL